MEGNPRVVVVLGVHRSGTSALAGALDLLGADLGHSFIPDNEWNERGHFELAEVIRIDAELLHLMHKTWDCIELPAYTEIAAQAAPLAAAARTFLAGEFSGAALFALKDPRMCRLLPFWQDVFRELHVADSYVIALRNPLSVARSLERRDGFATEKGCLLWLQHMRAAVAGTRGRRAVVVDYDRFLEDPAGEVQRMASHLKLTLRPDVAAALPQHCAKLVDPSLRHGTFDEASLYGDARVPDSVKDLYRALRMVARELSGLAPLAERTAHAKPSGADYPWLARALPHIEDELVRAREGVSALTGQIADARRAHGARDEAEAALREQIARNERDLADERVTIASLAEQLDHARAAADDHLQQIETARANIETLVAELEIARAGAHDQQEQIDAARDHIDALAEEIAIARAAAESHERQIASLAASLEESSRKVTDRERREAALLGDVLRLREEAGMLRGERDALAPALRETQEAAAALSADRDRLVQLERGARERSRLLDGQIIALTADVHALRARDEANTAELARLERTWYGRLARRLARRR